MKPEEIVNSLIADLKKQLLDDKIYSTKDLLLLQLLDNAYSKYKEALEKVENQGMVVEYLDYNQNKKQGINPFYTISLELSKEIFKYINALYLTPASRKSIIKTPDKEPDSPLEALTKAMAKAN